MGINYRQLRLEIDRQAPEAIYRKVKPLMQQEFDKRKRETMQALDEHEVSRELEEGPDATQSSFVDTIKGGNLYSLLGFKAGEEPVEAVREALDETLRLNISQTTREVRHDTIVFKTPVRFLSLADLHKRIAAKLPLEWTSRSFTDLLERGITGFPRYLFDREREFKTSRSGPAIETEHPVRSGSTRPIRYVSEILATFKRLISGK